MGSCFSKQRGKSFASHDESRVNTESSQDAATRPGLVQVFKQTEARVHPRVKECYESIFNGDAEQTDINLKFVNLGAEGAQHLATVLPHFEKLQSLRLWKTKIGTDGCAHLGRALSRMTCLRILSLEDNDIGSDGLAHLSDSLRALTTLEELFLHTNHLGPEGGLLLSESLKSLTKLKSLTVDENRVEDEAAIAILESLQGPTVRLIGLGYNRLTERTATEMLAKVGQFPRLRKVTFGGHNVKVATKEALKQAAPMVSFEF